MLSVITGRSPLALPALPLNFGWETLSTSPLFGVVMPTAGGNVSTVNVTGLLTPAGFPGEPAWVAVAVYCPVSRAGLALPEFQLPPVPVAVAVETTEPFT